MDFIESNKMNTYTKQQIEDLAGNALSQACAYIQDQLGVKTGDLAGLFLTGEYQDIIESILQDYIKREIEFKELATD
jgi:hypothetical protein